MKRILVLTLRALMLRCPNCGKQGVLESWFHMKEHCSACGLHLERREEEDYFLGGMMFNIVLAEFVYAAGMVTWLILTWPDPPWTLIQYVGIPFMIAAPFLFYPFSRAVWLAFDLMFRPASAAERKLGVAPDAAHEHLALSGGPRANG